MTYEQIFEVVKKHLASAVDDLKPESIEAKKSMMDDGANSLDMVEIVSRSMRELKIKVPRSELANLKDIDGLVALLLKSSQTPPAS